MICFAQFNFTADSSEIPYLIHSQCTSNEIVYLHMCGIV